ncbi:MAG: 3'(2'),5'-bisphosphate nucleotidase CysQ [Alphaproteobacteria bacterium]|nr:3'(2'),5'-bisphosphate nucleotidase CysQ [Alphaproteobacteria bacterium]
MTAQVPDSGEHAVLAQAFKAIALKAGAAILSIYEGEHAVRSKDDASPVTDADEAGERIILTELARVAPGIPVLAEEAAAAGHLPASVERFILVDPLDGTKEFIKRNGEFTVNIALVEKGVPLVGCVYAPAKGRLFLGWPPGEAHAYSVDARPGLDTPPIAQATRIRARAPGADGLVAVASRSHRDTKTEDYLARYTIKDIAAAGSSLKFCLVAAGEADIYPRHGNTMEWDTAAGDAVLRAAGGMVSDLEGRPLVYGKRDEGFLNPHFVARGLPG